MSGATRLHTERLLLREMTLDDAAMIKALNDNERVHRYTGDGVVADLDAARAVLRDRVFPQYTAHGVGRWAVVVREPPAALARGYAAAFVPVIGWCGLKWDAEQRAYDLGYRLFEEAWGHGYATEAAQATLAWGRARFPAARIVARARVENAASLRVLEKIGMRATGTDEDLDGVVALFA